EIVVDNFSFAPSTLSVPPGTTVTWTNRDDVPHNIVSVEQRFKSPVLDTDERFAHRFDAPGAYAYFCSLHPKMTGRIVVGGECALFKQGRREGRPRRSISNPRAAQE